MFGFGGLKRWEDLPTEFRNDSVRPYYEEIRSKKHQLLIKRIFDLAMSMILLVILSPLLLVSAFAIKKDSPGSVFFRQTRVTTYGRRFKIYKFRTMVADAQKLGSQVTTHEDPRITKAGAWMRKYRIDEVPQLFNVLTGDMSFVGTRPEVPKYVAEYSDEMLATLLLPAGITSKASIEYKDESALLDGAADPDETYISKVLPQKMRYNLAAIKDFSLRKDLSVLVETAKEVFFK